MSSEADVCLPVTVIHNETDELPKDDLSTTVCQVTFPVLAGEHCRPTLV